MQGLTLMNNVGGSVLPSSFPSSLAGTEEAFYHFSFLSRKHPKKLISIRYASPAQCIQSRALTIQSACLCVCGQCVCLMRETGRENPFVLSVNPQGHIQALVNRHEHQVRGTDDVLSFFKEHLTFMLMASKISTSCPWYRDVCWIIDLK